MQQTIGGIIINNRREFFKRVSHVREKSERRGGGGGGNSFCQKHAAADLKKFNIGHESTRAIDDGQRGQREQ